MSNREWTDAENELLLAITHRGQARPGAWAAVAEILDRQERTVRQRAGTLRKRAGLTPTRKAKAKPAKARYVELPAPPPAPSRQWWPFWRKH